MSLLQNRQVLLAKIESVYGTDPVLVGADTILVSEVTLTPLVAETEERSNIKPFLGNNAQIHVGENVTVAFKVEVAGAGAAGTAPAYGKLLRGCGFAETLLALTDAQYDPVSSSFESLTFQFNLDGQQHKLTGARGTVSIEQDVNKIPYFSFTFTGLYNAPSSIAAVTPDFSAFKIPVPSGKGRTSNFSLGGWLGVPIQVSIDLANSVTFHQTLTTNEVLITERKVSGKLRVEAEELSIKNFFTEALANTQSTLSIQQGQTAGNIVVLDAPKVQFLKPNYGDLNGIVTIDMDLSLIPTDLGDDELKITVK